MEVVVTGLGVVSAIGNTTNEFWSNLLDGSTGVDKIRSFDASNLTTEMGAEINLDYVFENGRFPKNHKRISRVALFSLAATAQALSDARLDASEHGESGGVFFGCSQGGFVESEKYFEMYFKEGKTSPLSILKPMNSSPASHISIANGIKGPILTVDNACSSANHALGIAKRMIEDGVINFAVVGGTDTVFSPAVFSNWCTLRVLSTNNQTPQKSCKPFSRNRDGTVLGEGSAVMIVESKDFAERRGVKPYANLIGYGSSADSYHIVNQSVEGPIKAITGALRNSNIDSNDVGYISAHATGTVVNDKTETAAIKSVFGGNAKNIPISGIKPAIGHTLAASAAFEAIVCVLALKTGNIPQTLNYDEFDPDCDLDYVTEGYRSINPEICISNSFGFGGSNGVVVFKKYRG